MIGVNKVWGRFSKLVSGAALAAVMGMAGQAHAALLTLDQKLPDITSFIFDIQYDGITLTATGVPTQFNPGGLPIAGPGASYSLSALVLPDGTLSGGSLNITGDLGGGLVTLLAGSLTAFGFDGATVGTSNQYNFALTVTDGLPDFGQYAGGNLVRSSQSADSFRVPEPSSVLLLGIGLMGFALRARRNSASA